MAVAQTKEDEPLASERGPAAQAVGAVRCERRV